MEHARERARMEKKKGKRGVLMGVVDPFRLWGERGYIGKHFGKGKSGDGDPVTSGSQVEHGKNSGHDAKRPV